MFDWFKVFDYGIAAAILVVTFFILRTAIDYLKGQTKSNISTYERFFLVIDTLSTRLEKAIAEISKSNAILTENLKVLTQDTHKRLETLEVDVIDIRETVHILKINQDMITHHFDNRMDEMSK